MRNLPKIDRRTFVSTMLAGVAANATFATAPAYSETVAGLYDNIPLQDKIMGDPNAPVTLLEYASMTCPHCKSFHERIMPAIKKNYIDTGKVKYVLRPFPFDGDRRGEAAFMLALCAPNDNYYPMLDALFSTQNAWGRGPKPVPELLRISKLAGMTEDDFKACLGNQDQLTKMIKGRNLAATKFRVNATPTVFINSDRYTGRNSVQDLSAALDGVLGS